LDNSASYKEAQELQNLVCLADGMQLKVGVSRLSSTLLVIFFPLHFLCLVIDLLTSQIPGMKKLLNRQFGYSDLPRRPLLSMTDDEAIPMFAHQFLNELLEQEKTMAVSQ
jgi:4-hydroxy-2-oxoglutarate aldolase